jgi:formylmethanofuran dehydrogenase subunit E-like metal-binding protein
VTMYKCTPDMGINVSMVNCLANDTADTYYTSMVAEMRQNQTREDAQDTINGTATQGLESAMNETGEALSNVTGDVVEGIKDLVNGSSQ